MPEGIEDRDADVWEPLIAVADSVGGYWPSQARVSAVTLVTQSKAATPSLGIRLLSDLRSIFDGQDAMATTSILAVLHDLDESPWGDLRGNARMRSTRLRLISAANIGPNLFHQKRTVSWLISIPRSCSRSSTFLSDSGNRTYIMTARRMISGLVLK